MMVSAQKAEQMLQIQFTVCQKGWGNKSDVSPLYGARHDIQAAEKDAIYPSKTL